MEYGPSGKREVDCYVFDGVGNIPQNNPRIYKNRRINTLDQLFVKWCKLVDLKESIAEADRCLDYFKKNLYLSDNLYKYGKTYQ